LLETLDAADMVIDSEKFMQQLGCDVWTPAMSIPYFHGMSSLYDIPAKIPYLHAVPDKARWWAEQLPAAGMRVGLVWKGNPKFENDIDRSLPGLSTLAPLATVPDVHFISLQKRAGEAEIQYQLRDFPVIDTASKLNDFSDTAALVANLELVICVDTAVAHLCGALGVSCWILLPYYKPDWRWFTDDTESRWYPDVVRLFRQQESGDWKQVVKEVRDALMTLLTEKKKSVSERK